MHFESLHKGKRLDGIIKYRYEDFVVEEMPHRHEVLELDGDHVFDESSEGKFLHCILIKKGYDTFEAVSKLRKKLRIKKEDRITFAGLKDKHALTSQLIGLYRVKREDVENIALKDIKILPIRYGNKVFLGGLWGNRFTITIRNIENNEKEIKGVVENYFNSTGGYFPNYYGEQRFGTKREITHLFGKYIILREFERGVVFYLTAFKEKEMDERMRLARELIEKGRYGEALEILPKKYEHERIMLKTLIETNDFRLAFLSLPKKFQRFVINSYQSYLFNRLLEKIVKSGYFDEKLRIPVVGYDYSRPVVRERWHDLLDELLEEEGIEPEMFYFKREKHLTTTTRYRKAFGKVHDFEILETGKDEFFEGKNKLILRFALRKSTYATTFLKEIINYTILPERVAKKETEGKKG